jgi:DNA polymerase I
MVYLVTNQKRIFEDNAGIELATAEQMLTYLSGLEEINLDLETTGVDAHLDEILSIQLGTFDTQFVIEANGFHIKSLKTLLETKRLVGQNLKFDLKFLYKKGIYPRKIWDTMIVEKVLYCGLPDVRMGLDFLTERYLGFKLDKSIRAEIQKEGLTARVIQYGADDIKYLTTIKEKQTESLREKELRGAANLENRFTPVLAYIEYCGFKLDAVKWRAKMTKDQEKLKQAEEKLDMWVMEHSMAHYIKSQLSLFDAPQCSINWASPQQVIQIFEELGVDCTVVEKGTVKKSVEAGTLEKQKHVSTLIPLYLEYRKAHKVVTTYGENFLDQIHPATGRLHTRFTQIMDTGRLSSGGKDRITKEQNINFQNIPSDKETRACFVAEPGNVLIISDYSGQEQIVLANRALDPNLLKFYDEGLADMHSFVASKMYPELEGLSLDQIKETYKDKRQAAKSAGFAINYGGQGITIAENLGLSLEEGNQIYDAYFQAFPGLKTYFEQVKKQGLEDGYVMISPLTKRKSYIPFFDEFKRMESEMNDDFWNQYRMSKRRNAADFPLLKEKVSKYFRYKGDIERKTLNFPIQGCSAEITKISCIHIFDFIIEKNLFGIVKFVNTIHDENVVECPSVMKEDIARMVEDAMCKAGELYCKRVPLKADPEISPFWKK